MNLSIFEGFECIVIIILLDINMTVEDNHPIYKPVALYAICYTCLHGAFLRISWNNSYNSSILSFKTKIRRQSVCVLEGALIFLKWKMKDSIYQVIKSSFFLFKVYLDDTTEILKLVFIWLPNQIIYNLALHNFFTLKNHALRCIPILFPIVQDF